MGAVPRQVSRVGQPGEHLGEHADDIGPLLPDPPGAQPSPGTAADPWKLNPEWSFVTETRMPVSGYRAGGVFDNSGAVIQLPFKTRADSRSFDLAPMDVLKVGSHHSFMFMPPVTHPDQFTVSEIMTLLPEATGSTTTRRTCQRRRIASTRSPA